MYAYVFASTRSRSIFTVVYIRICRHVCFELCVLRRGGYGRRTHTLDYLSTYIYVCVCIFDSNDRDRYSRSYVFESVDVLRISILFWREGGGEILSKRRRRPGSSRILFERAFSSRGRRERRVSTFNGSDMRLFVGVDDERSFFRGEFGIIVEYVLLTTPVLREDVERVCGRSNTFGQRWMSSFVIKSESRGEIVYALRGVRFCGILKFDDRAMFYICEQRSFTHANERL